MKLLSLLLFMAVLGCTTTKTVQTDQKSEINKSDVTHKDVKLISDQAEKLKSDTKTETKVTEEIEVVSEDPNLLKDMGIQPDSKSGTGTKPFKVKIKRVTETKSESNHDSESKSKSTLADNSKSKSVNSEFLKSKSESETESTDFWQSVGAYLMMAGLAGLLLLCAYIYFKRGAKWIF